MRSTPSVRLSGLSAGGVAALIGVAAPVGGLAIRPIWTFPATTASGADVLAFAATHQAALQVVMVANTLGVTLWLVFGSAVWVRMRARHPDDSMLAPCFATGLVGFVTLLFAGFTCFDVLVYRLPGPGEAKLLYDLAFGLLAMSGMPTAVALAAFAIAAYSHRTFDRSTGHLAAAGAAAHVLLLLSFAVDRGFFSLEGAVIVVIPGFLFLWIAVTGGTLLRQQSQQ